MKEFIFLRKYTYAYICRAPYPQVFDFSIWIIEEKIPVDAIYMHGIREWISYIWIRIISWEYKYFYRTSCTWLAYNHLGILRVYTTTQRSSKRRWWCVICTQTDVQWIIIWFTLFCARRVDFTETLMLSFWYMLSQIGSYHEHVFYANTRRVHTINLFRKIKLIKICRKHNF